MKKLTSDMALVWFISLAASFTLGYYWSNVS